MNYIPILLYLLPLLTLYIPRAVLGQACTMQTQAGYNGITVAPTVPTFTINSPTITIGSVTSPAPSPSAGSFSNVVITGVPSVSWSAWSGLPSPTTCAPSTTSVLTIVPIPTTNLNPRAPTPAPSYSSPSSGPTIQAYVTSCSGLITPTPYPTLSPATPTETGCIVFPMKGTWEVTVSVPVGFGSGCSFYMLYFNPASNAAANTDTEVIVESTPPPGNSVHRVSGKRVIQISSLTPPANVYYLAIRGTGGSTGCCLYGGFRQDIDIKYLGPP